MKYNIYLHGSNGDFNIFNLEKDAVEKIANAYKLGLPKFTINHKQYQYDNIYEIAVITNKAELTTEHFKDYATQFESSFTLGDYPLNVKLLSQFGDNVTSEFIDDELFGYEKEGKATALIKKSDFYINEKRLDELRELQSDYFDFSKLIRICEELNDNWKNENYFTVGLLLRTIINHVPPIFGAFTTFDQVIGNYGNLSFKKNMRSLNESLRSTADGYTHFTIRKKEPLPNEQQVDYKSNLDILLSEIVLNVH